MISLALTLLSLMLPTAHAKCSEKVTTTAKAAKYFSKKNSACAPEFENVYGRILKGKSPSDFASLTDNPERRVIFVMGPDGLAAIAGKPPREMLDAIGYPSDYVEQLIEKKTQFKLILFKNTTAQPATWKNVINAVAKAYPTISGKLEAQEQNFERDSFAAVQKLNETAFAEINKEGPEAPNFINLKRLEERKGTEWEVRAFLYNVIHLNELFSGDGFTRNENGSKGFKEYISDQIKIDDLKDLQIVDLPLTSDR